ncbi:SigE family RNA polymerase sigma factor [Streptantibioticus cattleyicolor]|uniref:SigE family RNA polymerase sigma factor n=1 Tax=Streptantibioticus cattleyicolor TaxID=29303 RepID=UPI000213D433|nr:SigE family RNA polymerase sigma factor [Streptantibioticus cattleyicolor]CCB71467.1 RNA polymerase sigma factor [Streptantibioticus cattleyicolor NRRL 8057 = DSM 46488]
MKEEIREWLLTVEEFEEFYAQTVARLTGQLYVMLGDLHEAQDVVQEAFVRGWSRRRRLQRDGQPEAWIRTVAWRLAVSRWRFRRRTADAWKRSGAPPLHVEAPGPERVALVDALRGLPAQQRRTLTLHYLCDLTVEQIAGETGLSASTVKTHLARGRTALADRLHDPRIEEAPDV